MSSGQMSFWANVFLGKCRLGKCPSGQMSYGQMSLGKCLYANVVWAKCHGTLVDIHCAARRAGPPKAYIYLPALLASFDTTQPE
jgi:hypothetical protein